MAIGFAVVGILMLIVSCGVSTSEIAGETTAPLAILGIVFLVVGAIIANRRRPKRD